MAGQHQHGAGMATAAYRGAISQTIDYLGDEIEAAPDAGKLMIAFGMAKGYTAGLLAGNVITIERLESLHRAFDESYAAAAQRFIHKGS